jgi:hypothetical protein
MEISVYPALAVVRSSDINIFIINYRDKFNFHSLVNEFFSKIFSVYPPKSIGRRWGLNFCFFSFSEESFGQEKRKLMLSFKFTRFTSLRLARGSGLVGEKKINDYF